MGNSQYTIINNSTQKVSYNELTVESGNTLKVDFEDRFKLAITGYIFNMNVNDYVIFWRELVIIKNKFDLTITIYDYCGNVTSANKVFNLKNILTSIGSTYYWDNASQNKFSLISIQNRSSRKIEFLDNSSEYKGWKAYSRSHSNYGSYCGRNAFLHPGKEITAIGRYNRKIRVGDGKIIEFFSNGHNYGYGFRCYTVVRDDGSCNGLHVGIAEDDPKYELEVSNQVDNCFTIILSNGKQKLSERGSFLVFTDVKEIKTVKGTKVGYFKAQDTIKVDGYELKFSEANSVRTRLDIDFDRSGEGG